MPLPYTGKKGEQNFEKDFVDALKKKGWSKEVLYRRTIPQLIENWKNIILKLPTPIGVLNLEKSIL